VEVDEIKVLGILVALVMYILSIEYLMCGMVPEVELTTQDAPWTSSSIS
jgi:hypothetical protein